MGRRAFLALKEVKSLEPGEVHCIAESQQELPRNLKAWVGTPPYLHSMFVHIQLPFCHLQVLQHLPATQIQFLLNFLSDLSLNPSFVAKTQFSRLGNTFGFLRWFNPLAAQTLTWAVLSPHPRCTKANLPMGWIIVWKALCFWKGKHLFNVAQGSFSVFWVLFVSYEPQ